MIDRKKLVSEKEALAQELDLYSRAPAPFPIMEDAVSKRTGYCRLRMAEIDVLLEENP